MKNILLPFFIASACSTLVFAESDFELTPALHITGVYGTSSADDPGSFAPGGHDPNRDQDLILQSLEPSLSLRWGEYLQGYATGLAFTDENDDLEWEWEEFFLKLVNPENANEIRAGRMLSRVGFHNPTHLHSWTTIDTPLPNAIFLGEDGLALTSVDVTFQMFDENPVLITLGAGQRPPHSHDHGHGEEGHDDEHGDEDHDEDHEGEDHEDEHGHVMATPTGNSKSTA